MSMYLTLKALKNQTRGTTEIKMSKTKEKKEVACLKPKACTYNETDKQKMAHSSMKM